MQESILSAVGQEIPAAVRIVSDLSQLSDSRAAIHQQQRCCSRADVIVEGYTVTEVEQRRKASQHAERQIRYRRPAALVRVRLMNQLVVDFLFHFLQGGI